MEGGIEMSSENEKLVIVDGSSLLVTAFWGNSPKGLQAADSEDDYRTYYSNLLKTSDGIFTNAVYPMLRQVMQIIREQKPTHMAIAFDHSRELLFRKQWYPQYKAHRRVSPYALQQQFDTAQNALKMMGLKVYAMDGFEADDIAGSICTKFKDQIPVCLITKDRDYLQLVQQNVKVWMMQKDQQTAEELKEKYCQEELNIPPKCFEYNEMFVLTECGILPQNIPDEKGLVGDSSDNIPGVAGIAEKSAIPLLQEYKTIEAIYNAIEVTPEDDLRRLWEGKLELRPIVLKKLKAVDGQKTGLTAKESALLCKRLATIITDLDVCQSLEELKIGMNREGFQQVKQWLQIKSL